MESNLTIIIIVLKSGLWDLVPRNKKFFTHVVGQCFGKCISIIRVIQDEKVTRKFYKATKNLSDTNREYITETALNVYWRALIWHGGGNRQREWGTPPFAGPNSVEALKICREYESANHDDPLKTSSEDDPGVKRVQLCFTSNIIYIDFWIYL